MPEVDYHFPIQDKYLQIIIKVLKKLVHEHITYDMVPLKENNIESIARATKIVTELRPSNSILEMYLKG